VLQVVSGHDHPWLLSSRLAAADPSWIAGTPPPPGRYAAKTRYRQADAPCTVESAGADGRVTLAFDAPQWAVTPGQAAVLYDGAVCLGGAVIASSEVGLATPGRPSGRSERPPVIAPRPSAGRA
jgi:tRNA-specific 2-thiouridylase